MYQPMLFVHWKQAKHLLLFFVVAAFALPLLAVQGLGVPPGIVGFGSAYALAATPTQWLPLFPALAGVIGVTLALTAWTWDHRLGHVYALSLPVERWEYALLKMSAGIVLGLMPAVALWLGAHLAAASVTLPAGLNAYPNQLAFRFFLATVLAYALFFALGSGTIRTTVRVLTVLLGLVVAVQFVPGVLGGSALLDLATDWLVDQGGPFEVFTGSWTLIDV
jgi:hypothetical protein